MPLDRMFRHSQTHCSFSVRESSKELQDDDMCFLPSKRLNSSSVSTAKSTCRRPEVLWRTHGPRSCNESGSDGTYDRAALGLCQGVAHAGHWPAALMLIVGF